MPSPIAAVMMLRACHVLLLRLIFWESKRGLRKPCTHLIVLKAGKKVHKHMSMMKVRGGGIGNASAAEGVNHLVVLASFLHSSKWLRNQRHHRHEPELGCKLTWRLAKDGSLVVKSLVARI
mmetsp:Transcript_17717/g.34547  ORF Transcript_17717/g.34547 Transcript_17717/m.34547 type:complete len:121 (-) Transcript_17717:1697-2059(-)|eukprot:3484622-Pleurochrysis_carterae.AAC.1